MMVDPQIIFQHPEMFLDYLIEKNSEGQFFDRKEVRNTDKKQLNETRENIKECISAFTNARGGVLVLGITDNGDIIGLEHLSESEYNSLVKIKDVLSGHLAQVKEWEYEGHSLLLFYCPEGATGICKTIGSSPKGWLREGKQNVPLTAEVEQRLYSERSKSYENITTCDFDKVLLNESVFYIFKNKFIQEQGLSFKYDDREFLINSGACKFENGRLLFTNAGYLFFSNNPASLIPSAQIRFQKFDSDLSQFPNVGLPIFERIFDGCLPEMLQKIRAFINESAFLKKYTYRDTYQSGIIEEPELPYNAVEEAIVNAIIHRDYYNALPIDCILYKDALVVRSPGKLIQPNHIPTEFALDRQSLLHYPRNPKIVQWARTMVDANGKKFVRAWSEGHKAMLKEMQELGLPAPVFHTNGFTTVVLYNNYIEREARIKKLQQPLSDEFTNLFSIDVEYNAISESDSSDKSTQSHILNLIKDKLQNLDWFIDRDRASRITAHRKGQHVPLDASINQWLRIFPAYTFRVYYFNKKYYLSIDFDVQLKNYATLDKLYRKGITDMRFRSAQVKVGGTWTHGTIQDSSEYYARVTLPEFDKAEDVSTNNVIPSLSKTELSSIAKGVNRQFNLDAKLKELSLSSQVNASKERSQRIIQTAIYIAKEIFPLSYNGFTAYMHPVPVSLISGTMGEIEPFTVIHSLKEPQVKFADNATESNILSGLSKFGSFSSPNKDIEIVPFCIAGFENSMQNLIGVIQKGSMSFKGMERTFKMGIKYLPVIAKANASEYLHECKRLVSEYNWEGDINLSRIFLIHIPEDKYPVTDINSPYFTLKEFLLEKGIPVQMLDTPTLIDPKFKDFNLALNIVAKTGGTPWVLPNALPDADLFIGLSYAQYKTADQLYRTMGYANVFNKYGQWQYYKGNIAAFNFEDKHIHLAELVRETLEQIQSLSDAPSIYIHYSSKFSRKDRTYIQNAAQRIRPNARVTFVWINTGHNIRMFDNRIEGNGSLRRGSYVITGKNQFYLSTTGYSTLKKTMGTPIMLEVNVTVEPFANETISYKIIAQHLLALTKLNWASTQSINGEPVTTKYAHDIARLSQVFYRHKGEFKLNKVLERTPWFI